MNHPPPKLDLLPTEIIQRIAASGPCRSIFALRLVNSTISSACRSWTVYRDLLCTYGALDPRWTETLTQQRLTEDGWARYAYAHSEAVEVVGKKEEFRKRELLYMNAWAPQLVVLRHPSFSHVKFGDVLSHNAMANGFDISILEQGTIWFCCAAASLAGDQPRTWKVTEIFVDGKYQSHPDSTETDPERHDRAASIVVDSFHTESAFHHGHWFGLIILYKALCELAPNLRHTLLRERNRIIDISVFIPTHKADRRTFPMPPRLEDLPMSSTLDSLPLPFVRPHSNETRMMLPTAHLGRMATPAFFEDGEWVGYVSTRPVLTTPSVGSREWFDQPMRLRFILRSVVDRATRPYFKIRSSLSIDHQAEFYLEGKVAPHNGAVVFLKCYTPNHLPEIEMHGFLTAFGIVGTIGRGLWWWMWKASWSREPRVQQGPCNSPSAEGGS